MPRIQKTQSSRGSSLKQSVLREFDGGWNVIDNDLSLNPEYAVQLDNLFRKKDGSLALRHGTTQFTDLSDVVTGTTIINTEYYYTSIITVLADGRLTKTDGTGTNTVIWDNDIANVLADDGTWANSIGYTVGDVIKDGDDDSYWKCLVTHTSAGAGTFAADRTATPANWEEAAEGWNSTVEFASFAQFKGQLIVCNGEDKPLLVDLQDGATNECQYLVDIPSGSNANVPICKYITAGSEFVLMIGDPSDPATVYISNQGSSGTWLNDSAPNNAVNVNLSTVVPGNNPVANGISFFRDTIVVGFDTAMVLGTLGTFDGSGNHTPSFAETIEAHGSLSHRTMINLGDDMLFLDNVGVPSLARTLLTETIRPDRPSELIDPAIQTNLRQLATGTLNNNTFAVHDLYERLYMVFVPNHDSKSYSLQDDPFIIGATDSANTGYTVVVQLDAHGVEEGDTITFASATGFNSIQAGTLNTSHTVLNVINDDEFTISVTDAVIDPADDYAGGGSSVTMTSTQTRTTGYIFHNKVRTRNTRKNVWSRFTGWNWCCGCRSALGDLFFGKVNSLKIYRYGSEQDKVNQDFVDDSATDIDFAWELPWAAFGERMRVKHLKYLGFDTRGTARFNVETYVDELHKTHLGVPTPNNSADFVGGSASGFGTGTQSFGGGRSTKNARLYGWTAKGKLVKLRISGSTDKPLRFIAVIVGYLLGGIIR